MSQFARRPAHVKPPPDAQLLSTVRVATSDHLDHTATIDPCKANASETHKERKRRPFHVRLLLRKMAKNSQTPLVSFEDLRPYVKLVGKNWWLLVGLAIVGYAGRAPGDAPNGGHAQGDI